MSVGIAAMNAPEWDLKEARHIVLSLLEGCSAKVYLFGSRANDTAGRLSDIDIAILPAAELPAGLLSDIREALEQSNILYRVDIVDLTQVSELFKLKVLRQGVLWND